MKAARERKGISLSQIARSTKINTSVLEGLENGNLSRWPPGLFRRSYFRDYASATGLPVESTTAEFLELFTDEERDGTHTVTLIPPAPVPQHIANAPFPPQCLASRRILAAAIDAGAVLAIAACSARVAGVSVWAAGALVALSYYSLRTCFGTSLGERWVRDWPTQSHSAPHGVEKPPTRKRRRRRSARSRVVQMQIVR